MWRSSSMNPDSSAGFCKVPGTKVDDEKDPSALTATDLYARAGIAPRSSTTKGMARSFLSIAICLLRELAGNKSSSEQAIPDLPKAALNRCFFFCKQNRCTTNARDACSYVATKLPQ